MTLLLKRKINIFLVLLGLLYGSIIPCYALEIGEVICETLSTHPLIESRQYNYTSAYFLERKALSRFLPTLQFFGDVGYENADNSSTRSLFMGNAEFIRREAALEFSQVLFDGGDRQCTWRQNHYQANATAWEVEETRELLAFQASQAFINVLRTRQKVEIYRESTAAHKEMLAKILKRTEGGVGRASEKYLARSRLALAEANLQEAIGNMEQAENVFVKIVGFPAPSDLVIPVLPGDLPANVCEAQEVAFYESPTLHASAATVEAARSQVGISRSTFLPTLSFDMLWFKGDQLNGVPGFNSDIQAVLRGRWNLFNGFGDMAQVIADSALFTKTIYEHCDKQRSLFDDIATSWDLFTINNVRLPILEEHRDESLKVFNYYVREFDVGNRTLFDVLNSQIEYYQARISETDGFFDRYINSYRLLASMGKLVDYFEACLCRAENKS